MIEAGKTLKSIAAHVSGVGLARQSEDGKFVVGIEILTDSPDLLPLLFCLSLEESAALAEAIRDCLKKAGGTRPESN